MSSAETVLWLTGLLLSVVLVGRLWLNGLLKRYAFFSGYLGIQLAQGLLPFAFPPDSTSYAWGYLLSQPVSWIFYVLLALELYTQALAKHSGIASLARWVLLFGFAISVLLSALTLPADLSRGPRQFPVLVYYTVIERGLTSSLLLFLLLISAFLIWLPVPVKRNLALHAFVLFVYFLSSSAALFVRNVAGFETTEAVSISLLAISNACLIAWIFLLNPQGETVVRPVLGIWSEDDQRRLVRQLDAINAFLLRSAGRQNS